MGAISDHKPVKLSVSIIFRELASLEDAEKRLVERFGEKEALETVLPFDLTDYYTGEFGPDLKRKLICFKKLIPRDIIPDLKIETNNMEDRMKTRGKRTVNIDPGYVTEAKLVLLTTKDYTHRVYIGKSIFAESTLFFRDGVFNAWPWTYPDYASTDLISYFNEVRSIYMKDIKEYRLNTVSP